MTIDMGAVVRTRLDPIFEVSWGPTAVRVRWRTMIPIVSWVIPFVWVLCPVFVGIWVCFDA
jgi:hypothetical protein